MSILTVLVVLIALACLVMAAGWGRNLYLRYRKEPGLARCHATHAVLWVAAILSLSACFATYRRLSGEQPNLHPVLNLILGSVYLLVLIGSFLTLGFFMYREDRAKGLIKRRFWLYERLLN